MICAVKPPVNSVVVGRPVMPYRDSMLGPPRPGGCFPAFVRETPSRASSKEVGEVIQVNDNATAWFSTRVNPLLFPPDGPGINGWLNTLTLRWLNRTKLCILSLICPSNLASYLSL